MTLTLCDIKLSYSHKDVLKGISMEFEAGKIHALLGENGAGKSSLVKILTGCIKPTSGQVFIDGVSANFCSPADSLKNGIACVYQRPFLADSISALENLKIGTKLKSRDIKTDAFKNKTCGLTFDLKTRTSKLTPDQRFFTAFSSALLRNPKILILDEPTALLTKKQSELLFKKLKSLAQNGMNIIIITHIASDLKFCDTTTKIEEGLLAKKTDAESDKTFSQKSNAQSSTADSQEGFPLSQEISPIPHFSRKERRTGKTGFIPADRTYTASNPNLTIQQVVCANFRGTQNSQEAHTRQIIQRANINIEPSEKAANLSGGMLQRLILERELFTNPKTLVLQEPFQGLDFASSEKLRSRLQKIESEGTKLIFV